MNATRHESGDGHAHGLDRIEHERPLWWALGLTAAFLVAEVVGAWISGSLALLSDAAHMVTDATALAIALAAIRLGRPLRAAWRAGVTSHP